MVIDELRSTGLYETFGYEPLLPPHRAFQDDAERQKAAAWVKDDLRRVREAVLADRANDAIGILRTLVDHFGPAFDDLGLEPKYTDVAIVLVDLLNNQQRLAEALPYARALADHAPQNLEAQRVLAVAGAGAGDQQVTGIAEPPPAPAGAGQATGPRGLVAHPRAKRLPQRLKFTGTCDLAEFQARCKEHEYWYHSYYFDNGFEQRGDYDIARDVDGYRIPDVKGKTVLDIGTGSGWFAIYLEQQGARVTTVDARGYCDFDRFGRDHYPDVATEKPAPDRRSPDGRPIYYSPVSRGFWIMKDLLGSQVEYVNARVYQLCPELFGGRKFDLVFMGSVLMHVRDPIAALMAAHSVCGNQLIATTYMLPDVPGQGEPIMRMWENAADGHSWWIPNRPCIGQWLKGAGFARFSIDHTVRLTADKVFVDAAGKSSGVNQSQQLIHAFV